MGIVRGRKLLGRGGKKKERREKTLRKVSRRRPGGSNTTTMCSGFFEDSRFEMTLFTPYLATMG
jgi:hypothetical protein